MATPDTLFRTCSIFPYRTFQANTSCLRSTAPALQSPRKAPVEKEKTRRMSSRLWVGKNGVRGTPFACHWGKIPEKAIFPGPFMKLQGSLRHIKDLRHNIALHTP